VIFEQLHDWTSDEDPSIRYFSGTAVYRKSLSVPWTGKRIFLALNSLGGAVRVLINRQEAGTVWCSPWTVDVTNYLKKGENTLELQVANSLVNRMIYDASLPKEERLTFSSTPIVKATDPLLPSGIIQVKFSLLPLRLNLFGKIRNRKETVFMECSSFPFQPAGPSEPIPLSKLSMAVTVGV
jgi:hypothetical protein